MLEFHGAYRVTRPARDTIPMGPDSRCYYRTMGVAWRPSAANVRDRPEATFRLAGSYGDPRGACGLRRERKT